jgi:predicted nucleotide-binding protein (sugar kinase/HSP70/actin superfamily)
MNEFHAAMTRRGMEVLTTTANQPRAVLLARSYTVGDPQVRLRLSRVLHEAGLTAVPMDMVPTRPRSSQELSGMFWYYGKRLLQVAEALKDYEDVAAISISNFGCGPDSFILHMLRRAVGDVPLLELEVDDHSEFNGVHTRLEAFRWALGSRRPAVSSPPEPPGKVEEKHLASRRLYIPRMSDHAHAFEAAFRSCGVDAEVLPEPTEESIAAGRAAVDGSECMPCAFLMGDMLKRCSARDSGHPAPAFFMIGGDGPCRLGQYPWLQRAVLDDHGYRDVPIFNASQDTEFYQKFGMMPGVFRRLVWTGTVAIDLLFRKWRERRVRASDVLLADNEYRKQLQTLTQAIEERSSITTALHRAFDALDRVPDSGITPRATVGLLGENYVRCNATANASLADTLERMGVEVWFPSLCEWVLYTNWTARLHCRYDRQPGRQLLFCLVDALQRLEMYYITRSVRGRLKNIRYPSVRTILRLSTPYIARTLEGETAVGIGRTVDLCRQGLDGVIHVSPFGCMVGRIVESVCRKVSDDLGRFPILNLEYDGRAGEHLYGLLESFAMQAEGWHHRYNAEGSTR